MGQSVPECRCRIAETVPLSRNRQRRPECRVWGSPICNQRCVGLCQRSTGLGIEPDRLPGTKATAQALSRASCGPALPPARRPLLSGGREVGSSSVALADSRPDPGKIIRLRVSTSQPESVTAIVCSHCADNRPSRVVTVNRLAHLVWYSACRR